MGVFITKFEAWWILMQPAWRGNMMPLKQVQEMEEEIAESWPTMAIGGSNGFIVVLLGLALWKINSTNATTEQEMSYIEILDDIKWVLWKMVESIKHTNCQQLVFCQSN